MSHVALRSKLQRKEESYKAFGFKLTFKINNEELLRVINKRIGFPM